MTNSSPTSPTPSAVPTIVEEDESETSRLVADEEEGPQNGARYGATNETPEQRRAVKIASYVSADYRIVRFKASCHSATRSTSYTPARDKCNSNSK